MSERSIDLLQLDGGCLVFDFTNTINTRTSTPAFDYLKRYDDILVWSQKAGLLTAERARSLAQYATAHLHEGELAFFQAKRAREVLYQLFSAIGAGKSPDSAITNEFNAILANCLGKLQLNITSAQATPDFANNVPSLDEPVYIVMKSAYDILTSENFTRLKECPNCGWLFIDRTKNGKRRWCDMNVCGSRDKAKRYYHRKKDEQEET